MHNHCFLTNFEDMENSGNIIPDSFKSISGVSEGLFKDNGSRFIAKAYPVETEDEVRQIVSSLKKEYHDARHHCYAYRLGYKGDVYRANDDGEPSSSAGRPILGQIDSNELSDILIVVIRYFGGIKLGIPGLIRAYKTSSADAIANATIITKVAKRHFRMEFGYLEMNSVMKIIKDLGLEQSDQEFGTACSLNVSVRLSAVDDFLDRAGKVPGCFVCDTPTLTETEELPEILVFNCFESRLDATSFETPENSPTNEGVFTPSNDTEEPPDNFMVKYSETDKSLRK